MDTNIVNDCVLYIFRKDKSPQRLPKLPVKSPIKIHIKSPVKKSPEELSPPESVADVKSPTAEIPEQVVSVSVRKVKKLVSGMFSQNDSTRKNQSKYFCQEEK